MVRTTIPQLTTKKKKKPQADAMVQPTQQQQSISTVPPVPNLKKELTSEERKDLLKTMPEGTVIDKFGNPTQNSQQRKTDILRNASGLKTDEQILQERQRQEGVVQGLQQAQQEQLVAEQSQQVQGASPDIGQALGAGLAATVPGLVGGAAAGAIAGAPIGGVGAIPGAIGGAAVGGVGAFLVGVRSNIKQQQSQQFAADQAALTKGTRYLNTLIADTHANPQNAEENIELFYKTLNMIDAAHAKTQKDSQEDLNKWLGEDGTAELAKFEIFDSTLRQTYITKFNMALLNPDPRKVALSQDNIDALSDFDLEE